MLMVYGGLAEVAGDAEIVRGNAEVSDELCGTQLAKSLCIEGDSPASLKKFDGWYFDFYTYLERYISFSHVKGKDVF